jgi:hypothetical protein
VPDNQGNVIVSIRVLGKNTSNLKFVCSVTNNLILAAGEELCVFDEVDLDKKKSFTPVLKNIADGEFENVLWEFDPTGTWKIFQVRVHEYIYP